MTPEGEGLRVIVLQGQGETHPDTGRYAYEKSEAAKAMFRLGSNVLGWDVRRVAFGDLTHLQEDSRYVQPMVTTAELAEAAAWRDTLESEEEDGDVVAPLSVGMMAGLAISGMASPETAIALAAERGKIMRNVSRWRRWRRGGMASFSGFAHNDQIEDFLRKHDITMAIKWPKPDLLTATGHAKRIQRAVEDIHLPEGVVATTSKVKAAAHSKIQARGRKPYRQSLERAGLIDPTKPLLANDGDGSLLRSVQPTIDHLVDQWTEMADWEAVTEALAKLEIGGLPVREVVEFGADTRFGLSSQIVRRARTRDIGPIRAMSYVPRKKKVNINEAGR